MNLNMVILKSTISLERNRISLSHYTIPPIDDFADLLASAIDDNSSQFGIKITNFYNKSSNFKNIGNTFQTDCICSLSSHFTNI